MGTKGIAILKVDVEELIEKLNHAMADEWLAYYQYWIGSKVVKGPMRDEVIKELAEHAGDELRHAEMLANRIVQLGGTPILSPEEWYKATNCGYSAPTDPKVLEVLKQNIHGEQCAIGVYSNLIKFVEGKDPVTFQMLTEILADEIEHEDDLQSVQEDIEDLIQGI